MNAEDRIAKQVLKILDPRGRHVFWGGIIVQLRREPKPDEWFTEKGVNPTACVDGVNLYYSEAYINSLTDHKLFALLIHEACHITLGHCLQMARLVAQNNGQLPYDPMLRNVAEDLAINSILLKEDMDLSDGLWPGQKGKPWENWADMESADYYYNLLDAGRKPPPNTPVGPGGDGPPSSGGSGVSGSDGDDNGASGQGQGSSIQDEVDNYTSLGQALPQPVATQEELDKAQRQLESDIVSSALSAKAAGSMPGSVLNLIDHLIPKPPKVDWRTKLHGICVNSIRTKRSYGKMNRRWPNGLPGGVIIPGKGGKGPGRILFATDTSGSMSDDDCNKAVAELENILAICGTGEVRIVQFDTTITQDNVYTAADLPIREDWKLNGRGGTAFKPVFDLVSSYKPTLCIVLTDGYPCDPWPTKLQCRTVFLLTSGIKEAPIGTSIVLD